MHPHSRTLLKELHKTLPMSATRARGNFKKELDRQAAERWRASARGQKMALIDKDLPSKKYGQLVAELSRRHANLLLQLRINHAPLQPYLARIGKASPPPARPAAKPQKPSRTTSSPALPTPCIALSISGLSATPAAPSAPSSTSPTLSARSSTTSTRQAASVVSLER